MQKLNTTGSLIRVNDTIYSYSTPIYKVFTNPNGLKLRVFNNTFCSTTTRKHQADVKRYYEPNYDLVVNNAPYGNWSLETVLKNEFTMLKQELEELNNKKRLGCNQAIRKDEIGKSLKQLELIREVF